MAETRVFLSCPECSSELVYPQVARQNGTDRWCLLLRCPNCERAEWRVFHDALVEQLDRQLERDTDQLVADLRRMARANMSDEIERFVAALNADAILPMDF